MRPIRERMQEMARAVDDHLPPGYGFIVFAYPFEPGGRMEYCANGQREDCIRAMKEWIANCEATGRVDVHQTRSIADQLRDLRTEVAGLLKLMGQLDPNAQADVHPEWPLQLRGDKAATDAVCAHFNRLQQLLKEKIQ